MERNVRVFTSFVRNLSRYGKKAIFPKTNNITWDSKWNVLYEFQNFFNLSRYAKN